MITTKKKTKKNKTVKRSRFATDLIRGFRELNEALETGEGAVDRYTGYNVRIEEILKPQVYTARQVRDVRDLLNASQAVFAAFLGASLRSVCDWEQGRSTPQPSVCRFMDEIKLNPEYFQRRLAASVKRKRPSA